MSIIKDIIHARKEQVNRLIARLETFKTCEDYESLLNQWCVRGLPLDVEDSLTLFDIVTDDEEFDYVITTARDFFYDLESGQLKAI